MRHAGDVRTPCECRFRFWRVAKVASQAGHRCTGGICDCFEARAARARSLRFRSLLDNAGTNQEKKMSDENENFDVWHGSILTCCIAPGVDTIHTSIVGIYIRTRWFWHWLRCFLELNDNGWPDVLLGWMLLEVLLGRRWLDHLWGLVGDIERAG